jgi:hypothetical protein
LRGDPRPKPDHPIPGDTIALFPQGLAAIECDECYRDSIYLDVPSEEPNLVRELKLEPWPQRRWAARLYHGVRPIKLAKPVAFPHFQPVEISYGAANIRPHRANAKR